MPCIWRGGQTGGPPATERVVKAWASRCKLAVLPSLPEQPLRVAFDPFLHSWPPERPGCGAPEFKTVAPKSAFCHAPRIVESNPSLVGPTQICSSSTRIWSMPTQIWPTTAEARPNPNPKFGRLQMNLANAGPWSAEIIPCLVESKQTSIEAASTLVETIGHVVETGPHLVHTNSNRKGTQRRNHLMFGLTQPTICPHHGHVHHYTPNAIATNHTWSAPYQMS